MDVINEEEKQFLKTLSRGRRMFERTLMKLQSDVIPGSDHESVIRACPVVTDNVTLIYSNVTVNAVTLLK